MLYHCNKQTFFFVFRNNPTIFAFYTIYNINKEGTNLLPLLYH